jgi:hypothetical protein
VATALDAIIRCGDCPHERPVTANWLVEVVPRAKGTGKEAGLAELVALLPRLKCSACGSKDISLRAVVDGHDVEFEPSDVARICAACGHPIPLARIAAVPDAVHCRPCQELLEAGRPVERDAPTICKRCGAEMVWRVNRNRYFLGCSRFPRCWYTQNAPGHQSDAERQTRRS